MRGAERRMKAGALLTGPVAVSGLKSRARTGNLRVRRAHLSSLVVLLQLLLSPACSSLAQSTTGKCRRDKRKRGLGLAGAESLQKGLPFRPARPKASDGVEATSLRELAGLCSRIS